MNPSLNHNQRGEPSGRMASPFLASTRAVLAFDADDTLWDCQTYFDEAERQMSQLLKRFGERRTIADELYQTERKNIRLTGFGCKAFILSMIETALRVSNHQLSGEEMAKVMEAGRQTLLLPATPLPGVEQTLQYLSDTGKFRMILFTKGELLDQQNKLQRSGLGRFFEEVYIVSDKTEEEYRHLCRQEGIRPEQLTMVGNSFKSDIQPVLQLGGRGFYIPFHATWQLEQTEEYDHPQLVRLQQFADLQHYF